MFSRNEAKSNTMSFAKIIKRSNLCCILPEEDALSEFYANNENTEV